MISDAVVTERLRASLSREERLVLMLTYADGLPADAVGLALDLPAERIRSIVADLRRRAGSLVQDPAHLLPVGPPSIGPGSGAIGDG